MWNWQRWRTDHLRTRADTQGFVDVLKGTGVRLRISNNGFLEKLIPNMKS